MNSVQTIRIKWVRSGIGLDHRQSKVVRSLGLRRLHQVVERPDTPQVRGLVAKVAHLVQVVSDVSEPVWGSTPAYVIKTVPPELAAASEESPPSQNLEGETHEE
jgi:large subunit ribosomal protein L30